MPHRSYLALAALVLTLVPLAPLDAAEKNGSAAIRGIGSETCESFTKAYSEKAQGLVLYESWLDGFISSLNLATANVYDVAPWQGRPILFYLTDGFCKENPKAKLFEAAQWMRTFFKPFEMAKRSDPVEAKVGEKSIRLYGEVLRRAQEILIQNGLLQDKADGIWGAKSQAAFEGYQERTGMTKTGLPDQETLFRLFVEAQQKKVGAAQPPRSGGTARQSQPAAAQRQAPAAQQQPAAPGKLDLNLLSGPPRQ